VLHADALGYAWSGLPDDLVNFLWDPVTAAVAVGWPGAEVVELRLLPHVRDDVLSFEQTPDGDQTRVVLDIDAPAFNEVWLQCVAPV
jgi:hypothetical protein